MGGCWLCRCALTILTHLCGGKLALEIVDLFLDLVLVGLALLEEVEDLDDQGQKLKVNLVLW